MSVVGARIALCVLLAAGALTGVPAAGADQGVSIDVGRIDVAQDLLAGGAYRLPVFGVTNPGSTRTSYRLRVTYIEGQQRRRPPESWFRFSPERVTLLPGRTRPVLVRLALPTGADAGDYEALLGAQLVSEGSGARVGATAAARLTFAIAPSSLLQAWWLRVKTLFGDGRPWTYAVPALALAMLAGRQLRRRLTVTVARRA